MPRQRDTRVVVIVDLLLHAPFTSLDAVGAALQTDPEGAGAALRAAAQCTAPNAPLIDRYGDAWLLGASAREAVMPAREAPWFADVVAYASTRFDECQSTTRLLSTTTPTSLASKPASSPSTRPPHPSPPLTGARRNTDDSTPYSEGYSGCGFEYVEHEGRGDCLLECGGVPVGDAGGFFRS